MPEKLTRFTQRNVTWQTGSEYRRLTLLSGRTLNYVSFMRKVQIPEIFVSPSYVAIALNTFSVILKNITSAPFIMPLFEFTQTGKIITPITRPYLL